MQEPEVLVPFLTLIGERKKNELLERGRKEIICSILDKASVHLMCKFNFYMM